MHCAGPGDLRETMHLDTLTLIAAGAFATLTSSILLFAAWAQIRTPALLWWAASAVAHALSIGLIAFGLGSGAMAWTAAGGAVGALAPALLWAGFRRFNHRRQLYILLFAGIVATVAAGALPPPAGPDLSTAATSFAVWIVYLAASIYELVRGRGEALIARWPLIGFLGLHAFMFVGGVYDTLSGSLSTGIVEVWSSWFSIIHFETIIYTIGMAVFTVLLTKERSERRHILAARHDSLTGVANRGAFLEGAERRLRRCEAEGMSFSLIMFDLDRFKEINDTFGHDVGDQVLRTFTETAQAVLRPNDLFGRYGGEEFTLALPGATIEAAYVIAERIRVRFSEQRIDVEGVPLAGTVSAGVATAGAHPTLEAIIHAADQSMYRAKSLGRNRVERVPREGAGEPVPGLVRIA